MKLTARFHTGNDRIRRIISTYTTSVDIELQQRAVEYTSLFSQDNLRPALLEKMPVREHDDSMDRYSDHEGASDEDRPQGNHEHPQRTVRDKSLSPPTAHVPAPTSYAGDLLDLLGGGSVSTPYAPASHPPPALGGDIMDLLGGPGPSTPSHVPSSNGLMDFLGDATPAQSAPAAAIGYDKNGLRLTFSVEKTPANPALAQVTVVMTNSSPFPVSGVMFQAAVPKTIKIQVGAASGTDLPPSNQGSITQLLRIANPQNHPLRFRIKFCYTVNGQQVQDQDVVGPFN